MVVTTLRKEGAPLVRYRTRDLTRAVPGRCACGSILPRHDRLLGRSDDMFIIKATNVYPGQIDDILGKVEGVSSEFNVILERADGRDSMYLKVERAPDAPRPRRRGGARHRAAHQARHHRFGRGRDRRLRHAAAVGA